MTVKAYLAHKGETVTAFAKRCGVSRSSLIRIERNGRADSARIAQKIIDHCEGLVTAVDLFPLQAGQGAES